MIQSSVQPLKINGTAFSRYLQEIIGCGRGRHNRPLQNGRPSWHVPSRPCGGVLGEQKMRNGRPELYLNPYTLQANRAEIYSSSTKRPWLAFGMPGSAQRAKPPIRTKD